MLDSVQDGINELSGRVIGAAIEVHKTLGPGFAEAIYQAAMCSEFRLRHIPYKKERKLPIFYKGEEIGFNRLDLIVADELILELKSADELTELDRLQLLAYLNGVAVSAPSAIAMRLSLP